MLLQGLRSSEQSLAQRTPVRFLSSVNPQVTAVTVGSVETFPTLITAERLLSGMDAKVAHVVAQTTKAFPAFFTLVWFLSGVSAHMLFISF